MARLFFFMFAVVSLLGSAMLLAAAVDTATRRYPIDYATATLFAAAYLGVVFSSYRLACAALP